MSEIHLRDYQARDIERIRNAYREGHKRVLYVSPTGSGKTTLFCAIARGAIDKGGYPRVVVHRKELKTQVQERFNQFSIQNKDADVAMVRSAMKGKKPSLLIPDEAHHAVAGSWQKLIEEYPDVPILGVTATPCRLDGKGLGDVFDTMIVGPSVKELTAADYLVPAKIWAPSAPDMTGVRRLGGEWNRKDTALAVERSSITGDAVQHYLDICPTAPAVAFCVDVEHARRTAAAFNAAGVPADVILGSSEQSEADRERVVAELSTGKIRVLCSVEVISEGFDIPIIECAILLRPTQSLALFLQQIGRALRPAPGKFFAYVLDHAGNVMRHGFPDDDFEWSLETGVTRKNPSDLLKIVRCDECFGVYRSGPSHCPYCGKEHTAAQKKRMIEERAGQLALISPEIRAALRFETERKMKLFKKELARAVTLEDLLYVAEAHCKKKAWAYMLWKNSAWRRQASA